MKTKIYLALVAVMLLGVIAFAKTGSPAQAKRKWEHKIVSVNGPGEGAQALARLQEDGWELVTVVMQEYSSDLYFLKREK